MLVFVSPSAPTPTLHCPPQLHTDLLPLALQLNVNLTFRLPSLSPHTPTAFPRLLCPGVQPVPKPQLPFLEEFAGVGAWKGQ